MKPSLLRPGLLQSGLLLALPALAACGGSGSGGPQPIVPIVDNPPAPASPTVMDYNSAEYRRSNAAVSSGAITAWEAGADGRGITVAIIDSGIDPDSAEFAGRIHSASRDVTSGNRGITDTDGHGTAVAGVLAAARNDQGIVGLAPAATLAVMKADTGSSCASDDGCSFSNNAIAAGIDAAVAAGARAINISLGGGSGGFQLTNAVARATAAGVVIVVASGNDGDTEPDPLALAILQAGNPANILIAGGRDEQGEQASFANQAGMAMNHVVTALASRIRSFDTDGTPWLYSGTSFATPQVTAAVALLAQAFPTLSGAQIVDLILTTAADAGAPGTDPLFGRGNLDLARAFAPQGTTSLAGTTLPVSLSGNGNLGAAMGGGDAFGAALGQVAVTDGYGRTYNVALGRSLRPAGVARLRAALQGQSLHVAETAFAAGPWQARLSVRAATAPGAAASARQAADSHLGFAQRGMDAHAASRRLVRETRLTLDAGTLRFGVASGPSATALLPGHAAPGLLAPDGLEPDHDPARGDRLLAMTETRIGNLRLAAAMSHGRELLGRTPGLARVSRQQRASIAADLPAGPLTFAGRLTHLDEEGSFLGTRLSPGFGLDGGRSWLLGAAVNVQPMPGVALRIAGTQGWHRPRLGHGLLAGAQAIRSSGWSAGIEAPAPFGPVSLRYAQPLVLTDGYFRLTGSGALAPASASAREHVAELGWTPHIPGFGPAGFTLFHRANPGHRPGPADQGAALVLSRSF